MRVLFVAGHKSETAWSELVVLPMNKGMSFKINSKEFVWIILVTVKAANEARELGQNLVAKINEAFTLVTEPLEAVDFKEWWEAALPHEEEVSITAVQVNEASKAIITAHGDQRILVQRGVKCGYLLSGKEGNWQVMGGQVKRGDKWVLGTGALFDKLSASEMGEELTKVEAEEAQASIVGKLQETGTVGAAGAIIDFGELVAAERDKQIQEPPQVYLKEKPFKRRQFLALGLLVILIIGAGVWLGGKRREVTARKNNYDAVLAQADNSINQAKLWASENNKASAAAILSLAEQNLTQNRVEFKENLDMDQELERKIQEIKAEYTKVSGEEKAQVNQAWYDLTIIRDGLVGIKMDQTEGKMEILDGVGGVVATLGFDKKEAGITGSGELLKDGTLLTTSGKRTLVFVPQKGVLEINTTQKTTGGLIPLDSSWQRVTGMALFSGNVYMIDAGAKDIYVYPSLTSGVGERKRWLKPGQEPDLSNVIDMAIDGDIWTLDQIGKIRRFRQGEQIDYVIKGLEKPLGKSVAIVIPPDSDYVYVLDQENKRVVVLDKKGTYLKQILWEGLAGATDMAVDEVGGGILALSGSQVYRIPIEVPKQAE